MKFLCILLISVFTLPLASAGESPVASPGRLPLILVRLASKAKSSRAWPELRRYAITSKSPREQALAYFVLGYREYQSGQNASAESDLAKAASTGSPVADLATYFCASAAYKGGYSERVAGILNSFSKRYPSSMKHFDAIQLLARAYLQTGRPQSALRVLQSEPEVRERPALALLMAHAYEGNGQLLQAALTFQDIYYAFPTTPQADAAGNELDKLKNQLGVRYPPVSDEIATARVERLYITSHYSEALKGYEELLTRQQNNAWAWRWNLGRAKCLIRLGRGADAIETLVNSTAPTSEMEAERLATLVDAYAQTEDDSGIAETLNKLRSGHFKSHWHAVALLRAANYFMYKGEWDIALLYYTTLEKLFPETPQGSEASWRLAWITYLTGKPEEAQASLLALIKNYPDSPHVQAAIYFLARVEENQQPALARGLYEFLRKRYLHSYYGQEAAQRLSVMLKDHIEKTTGSNVAPPFSVSGLTSKVPAADPPAFGTCPPPSGKELVPFNILDALHLDDLAEQDLLSRLARHPDSAPLVLTFGKYEAKRGRTDRALQMTKKIVPDYYSQSFSELPREIWQLLFPKAYVSLVRRYAIRNHLNPYLVMGLIRQESEFNAHATSRSDARGLMQILPSTVTRSRRYRAYVKRMLYNPAYNLRAGCAFLRQLLKRYHGNTAEALAAYNAGPSRVDQWLSQRSYQDQQEFVESIPFRETRVYIKGVFAGRGVYHQLEKGAVEFAECPDRSYPARRRSEARFRGTLNPDTSPLLTSVRSTWPH